MTQERKKLLEGSLAKLKEVREDIKYLLRQEKAEYNLMSGKMKDSGLGKALREEMDDLTAAWRKISDAIGYLTVLAGEPEAEEQEPEKKAEEKPTAVPNKRLRIRVEDADDGEVEEFEADSALLYLAQRNPDGVEVQTHRNLKGIRCTCALAMTVKKEEKNIMDGLFAWDEEGGAQ